MKPRFFSGSFHSARRATTFAASVSLAVLVALAVLSGCANTTPPIGQNTASTIPTSASAGPTPPSGSANLPPGWPETALTILFRKAPDAAELNLSIRCQGSHIAGETTISDPDAACVELDASGPAAFSPSVPDRKCTMQLGGPQTARVFGTLKGKPVDKTFDQSNGCAIADWNLISAVFGGKAGAGL